MSKSMPDARTPSDERTLHEVNQQYVDAFMNADAGWYAEHLADDFVCIEADSSVLDKPRFLQQAAASNRPRPDLMWPATA